MSDPSMDVADVIKAVNEGKINWINVWWVPTNVRQVAIERLSRLTSGPTGTELLAATALVGLEWLYWKRPPEK